MFKFLKLSNLMVIVVALLFVATIITAIKSATAGSLLVNLENQANQIEEQNVEIKNQIVLSTSLSQISKQVDSMNMIRPEKFVYLYSGERVASILP